MDSAATEDNLQQSCEDNTTIAPASEPDHVFPTKPNTVLCNGDDNLTLELDTLPDDSEVENEKEMGKESKDEAEVDSSEKMKFHSDESRATSLDGEANNVPCHGDTLPNSLEVITPNHQEEESHVLSGCVEDVEETFTKGDAITENGVCSSSEDSSSTNKEVNSNTEPTGETSINNDSPTVSTKENDTEKSDSMLSSHKDIETEQSSSENLTDNPSTITEIPNESSKPIEQTESVNTDSKETNINKLNGSSTSNNETVHSMTCIVNQEKKLDVKPKKQKARKSCQPQGDSITPPVTSSYQASTPPAKSAINVASFAKKTIKVTELESVLGIKTKSLDKMDAKTLDKLVLLKAQQQRAKIDSRLKQEKQENSKIQARPVKPTLSPPKLASQQTMAADRRNSLEVIKTNNKTSGPSSKTKGRTTVSPNQLITQFMVREPVQKTLPPLLLRKDSENTTCSQEVGETDTNDQTQVTGTSPSKQHMDSGTSASGVSAYIAGQHLLSRSKKKKKIYKGKSGNYRLPGQKKAGSASMRRRDSADSGGALKQRRDSQEEEKAGVTPGGSSAGEDYQKNEDMEDLGDELPDLVGDLETNSVPENSSSLIPRKKKRKFTPRRIIREKDLENDETNNDIVPMEGKDRHSRKSSRKRKLPVFNDDTESTNSTETYASGYESSDNELEKIPKVDEEEMCLMKADETEEASKRRKVRGEEGMVANDNDDDDDNDNETMGTMDSISIIPHLSPIKAPSNDHQASASKTYLSPPKISPALPFMGCSPRVGPLPTMEEKKPAESAAVPQEIAPSHPYKFMNTPNGVSYPVTPPETPDSTVSSLEERSAAAGDRDREGGRLPVCFCRLPGTVFNCKTTLFCQALDSIDGKVHGCMNKVGGSQLLRPSVKIPFMAMCESHKQRLKLHQCCPGCGNFCTQGTFYQCKESSSPQSSGGPVHYYHKHCQVHKDDKYFCPHCGDQSAQVEVYLQAAQAKQAAAVKYDRKEHGTNARMEFRRCSTDSVRSSHSNSSVATVTTEEQASFAPCPITPSLRPKFSIKLDTERFPISPCKKDLEKAIQQFSCEEKKKKFRASNKNLYQACKSNDLERVLYLLYEGIDPNEKFEDHKQQSPIHVAAAKGYLAIVHLLVQARASVHAIDEELRTALMYAAEEGNPSVVRYLLKCQALPDARASDGMTPLHLAAQSGEVESVKHIVQTRNINVNSKDDGGWTPMIWAAEHRHIDTVRFLLEVGSDPNLRDNEDNTGLHWAVYSGSTDIAELFLNAGCDIEAANEHGDRPLHIATRQDHYECVVLLLARGADSTAVNNRSDTPLNCCFDVTSPIHMAIQVNQQLKKVASLVKRPPRLLHRDVACGKESYPIAIVNEFDEENYPTDYLYVNDYVETVPMNMNRVITSLTSCECRDNCVSLSCECSRNSVKCWYTDEGKLPDDFNFSEPPYVFECNKACKCWSTCQNRVVQMGISVRLQVFRAPGKGWGVRTLLQIPKGTYVCEYIGEVLSDAEADRREDDSYLFDLDNRDSDSFCIDARQYGNVSRFINHRCEPNLSPVKVFVDHQDLRFPRICFFANKDIKAYEELGFDYGDKFWVIKYKQFTCTCDSTKCRYSKDTIHKTVAEYYRRIKEAEESDS